MTTTFTAYDRNNGTALRGLTAVQAAQEILSHDSHYYELRRDNDLWCLFGGLTQAWAGRKPIWSNAASEAEAWEDIALQVIKAGWQSVPVEVMTDADYDAMLAEIASED